MSILMKSLFRLFRIFIGKKGVYGEYGAGNKFTKGVFLADYALIGDHNYLGPYTMINNAIIGNYCSFGPGVKIGQGEHSIDFITTCQKISKTMINHSLNKSPTIIGNDVWCGANVVVLQGVQIGDGAVIGANAVVTRDIPDYAIAVGVPAKIIKYRFDSETIEVIKKSGWYNREIEEAKIIIKSLETDLFSNFEENSK
nr:CatB-related O-acetyltransferase [uncultured Trichococcus sp.]